MPWILDPQGEGEVFDRIVLVDSSVWVNYFRQGLSKEAETLDQLLSLGLVATCDPIKAEIISGAPSMPEFVKLRELLEAILFFKTPSDIWNKIAEQRFLLARKGIQSGLIDLWIANTAKENNALIWTFDKDFSSIIKIIHFETFQL